MISGLLLHIDLLTRQRDAQGMNLALLSAFHQLFHVRGASVFEIVMHEDEEWVSRVAWLCDGAPIAAADPHDVRRFESFASHPAIYESKTELVPVRSRGEEGEGLTVPLLLGQEVVCLFELQLGAPLADEQFCAIEGLLAIYRNVLSLLEYGQRDELTGLLNRKTFDHGMAALLIEPEVREVLVDGSNRRKARPDQHWIVVIDIDHFKRINDGFGHIYGDEVLILMANLMRKSFRKQDKLYRFGGEEFVVLLRHLENKDVFSVLERFRETVAAYPFPQVGQVTASVGYAPISLQDASSVSLGNADEALYYAKEHGRNQVRGYADLIESGLLKPKVLDSSIELF